MKNKDQLKVGARVRLKAVWPGAEAFIDEGGMEHEAVIRFEKKYTIKQAAGPMAQMSAAMATLTFDQATGAPCTARVYWDELEAV